MTDRAVSDTPRTDAAQFNHRIGDCAYHVVVSADFARQLECESDHLRAQLRMCVENGKAVDKANRAEIARLVGELATANACAKFPEATLEAIESLKRELAEAQREIAVWSWRYAVLEALYLAALKS